MKIILLAFLSAIGLSGCQKEKIETPPAERIQFAGISETDFRGVPISVDTSDWKSNDIWSRQESDLFASKYKLNCPQIHNYKIDAFPNPGNGNIILLLNKNKSSIVEFRLVDENFKKLISKDAVYQDQIALDASSFGIKDTVRLYYKFIDSGCEFRGHGDVVIE